MDLNVNAVVLSRNPFIIVVANGPRDRHLGDARLIAEHYQLDKFYLYISPQFTIWKKPESDKIDRIQAVRKFMCDYPNATVSYLCNEEIELDVFSDSGVSAYHVNQNAFVDHNVFYPFDQDKKFDAIYTGQLQPFKRHHLAQAIERLALIYYGSNQEYLKEIRSILPNAKYINGLPPELGGDGQRTLEAWEMSKYYNQSKVGLCLSAAEGGMYACTEYLLCGLPVITTQNVGGRNDFLDSENSLTVEATKEAVAEGVRHFIQSPPLIESIRSKTLQRIKRHRAQFFFLIDEIFRENGQEQRRFENEFPRVFRDKLWKSRCPLPALLN